MLKCDGLEVTIKQSEIAKDNLITSLTTLSHPEMVERAEPPKTVTVHWRDGSISTERTTHRSRGYCWEEEDLTKLKSMIDNNVDQVWILKEFPDYSWRALTERRCYHFDKGWWKAYSGEKKYTRMIKWADTNEAKQQLTQLNSSRVRAVLVEAFYSARLRRDGTKKFSLCVKNLSNIVLLFELWTLDKH